MKLGRMISILLIFCLSLLLAACGEEEEKQPSGPNVTESPVNTVAVITAYPDMNIYSSCTYRFTGDDGTRCEFESPGASIETTDTGAVVTFDPLHDGIATGTEPEAKYVRMYFYRGEKIIGFAVSEVMVSSDIILTPWQLVPERHYQYLFLGDEFPGGVDREKVDGCMDDIISRFSLGENVRDAEASLLAKPEVEKNSVTGVSFTLLADAGVSCALTASSGNFASTGESRVTFTARDGTDGDDGRIVNDT